MKRALALCAACLSLASACARGGGDTETAESTDPISSGSGAATDAAADDAEGTAPDACPDADHDGHHACAEAGPPDCDDTNANVYPGAAEVCDLEDNDCDGETDEVPAVLAGSLVTPVDPHWKIAGSAILSGGWAKLTAESTYTSGAIWWDAPSDDGAGAYTFDDFEASFTFFIQQKEDGADGLAFAWVPGDDVTRVGRGPFYGAGDLGGYAVAIDTFQNPGEPAAPFLTIMGPTNNAQLGRYTIPDVRDGEEHTLRVRLNDGAISVWMTTRGLETNYVSNLVIPGYVPFRGRWGVTGGTGALSEAHWARDVSMTFPRGQGCIP